MGNEHGCLSRSHFVILHVNVIFRNGIKGGGGLIQHQDRTILIQGSCQHQPLSLTTGKHHTVQIYLAADVGVNAFGELRNRSLQSCFCQAKIHFPHIRSNCGLGHRLRNGSIHNREILEHSRKQFIILPAVKLPDVLSVEQNPPFGGIIETTQQLHQCGFTCTVQTNNCQFLARMDGQIDIFQNVCFRSGVTEGHIFQSQHISFRFGW